MEHDKTNSDDGQDTKSPEKDRNEPGRYVFECQRCGECCESKESIVVSIADLERWGRDLTLPSLFPYLNIEADGDYIHISLGRPGSEDKDEVKGCPLYDSENKICNIYYSMPLFCKSFPLGYEGKRYFIKDGSCPGIGKGKMSSEGLREARESAQMDFDSRVSTALVLPALHGLVMGLLLEHSKKQVDQLTDDQKEQLKEILGHKEGEDKKSE